MAGEAIQGGLVERVLRSTVSNYVGKFVQLATWFFVTPFMLRQLGSELYGLWALVGSVVAYGLLFDFGIAGAVTKYVAEYRARNQMEKAGQLIATALALYTALGLGVIALTALIAPVFPHLFNIPASQSETAIQLVLLTGIGVGLSIPCATAPAVLHGLQRFDVVNLMNIAATLLSAGGMVAILVLGGGVIGVALIRIAVMVLMQVPSVWCIYRVAPTLRFGLRGANRKLVRTVASFSSSLFLIHVGGRLETETDELVIGAFLPVSSVTPYEVARRLSTVPQVLTEQFLKVLFPLASELSAADNQTRLRSLYLTSTRLTLAILLPVAGVLMILARPALSLWVGPAYVDCDYLVILLTLASLIDTSQWPAGFVLQGMAKHRRLAILSLCSGLMNLLLSIVLIRFLGLSGVALGTLIPTTILCFGFVLPYAMRVIGVDAQAITWQVFLPALIPALPMVLATYLLRAFFSPSSLLAMMGVAAIAVLVYVTGFLSMSANHTERRLVHNLALGMLRRAEL